VRLKPGITLHQCADCAYWEPALTYFGEPTGQGGCRFATARNRKDDKLRECDKYQEGKPLEGKPQTVSEPELERKPSGMSELLKSQEVKMLGSLIIFWNDSLAQHRLLMSPSTVYLVEQTIKSLEILANMTTGQSRQDQTREV